MSFFVANTKGGHWVWEWLNGEDWTAYHIDDATMLENRKEGGSQDRQHQKPQLQQGAW